MRYCIDNWRSIDIASYDLFLNDIFGNIEDAEFYILGLKVKEFNTKKYRLAKRHLKLLRFLILNAGERPKIHRGNCTTYGFTASTFNSDVSELRGIIKGFMNVTNRRETFILGSPAQGRGIWFNHASNFGLLCYKQQQIKPA